MPKTLRRPALLFLAWAVMANLTHAWLIHRQAEPAPHDYSAELAAQHCPVAGPATFEVALDYLNESSVEPFEEHRASAQVNKELSNLFGQAKVDFRSREYQTTKMVDEAVRQHGGEVSPGVIYSAAVRGLAESVNDSRYLTPEEYQDFCFTSCLPESGIGAIIEEHARGIKLATILPNHPAQAAGLQSGDIITRIDGETTRGMSVYTAVNRLRGLVGQPVRLQINRGEGLWLKTIELTLVRGPLNLYQSLHAESNTIEPIWFASHTYTQMEAALANLKRQGVKKVTIDLRQTSAGTTTAAAECAGLFLPTNTLVAKLVSPHGEHELRAGQSDPYEFDLTVLVGPNTAEGAEVFADALRRHAGARLVGETTAGCGNSAGWFPMPDGSALALPVQSVELPDGTRLEGNGLQPNMPSVSDILSGYVK